LTPVLSGLSNVRQFTDVVDCADQHDGRVVSANANGSCPANTITIVTTRNGVVVRGSTACVDPSM
jgi:hypothetical protein